MAFFALSTISIVSIVIGGALVCGVLVVVSLKMFRQNREEQQVKLAERGMQLSAGKTYVVGKNIAIGKYSFAVNDASHEKLCLLLNGQEKRLTSGEILTLTEEDVICPQISVVATICK